MNANTFLDRLSRRFVPWLIQHRRGMLLGALGLSLLGLIGAVLLYSDLRSGIEELLPESAPSVIAAREVAPKMHSTTRLSVVLEGADPDGIARFADDLAKVLRSRTDLVDAVEYRTDDHVAFAKKFGLLYVDTSDLRSLRDRISARVAWERQHSNPLMLVVDDTEPAPSLDFTDIETKYASSLETVSQFRKGYYQTMEGKLLVMLVRPPESSTGLGANERLFKAVGDEIAKLKPTTYDPALRVGYTGEVAELVEEQAALVADLAASTVLVLVCVLGALWLYYRRWGAIAAVFGPLAVGCATTFGIAYLMVGHLNANTAFLGSIVVGNGINVGIIYVARYLEERRARKSVDEALQISWASTMPATFVAAFGAGLAYLSLATTAFRGFNQFGAVGGVGMALCWLAVYTLLPPFMSVIEAWRPIQPGLPSHPDQGLGRLTGLVEKHTLLFRGISIVLLLGCFVAIGTYKGELVEYDLTHLRSKKSAISGALYWAEKSDQVFRKYLTPVVLFADTPDELEKAVAVLNKRRQELGDQDPFREVQSLHSMIPPEQEVKIALLNEIRALLPDNRLKKLDPDLRKKAELLRPPADVRAVTLADLPGDLKRALVERPTPQDLAQGRKEGQAGRVALAFPKKVGRLDLHEAEFMKALVRGSFAQAGVHAQALNPLLLVSDIDEAIWYDGPKATLIAFILVCMLVFVVLRKIGPSLYVIGALLVGLAGLIGVAAALHERVNFLNFVVLPITFGIGVDYAVNIVQRYRIEGTSALGRILHETGGAVALCSATTVIGYGSLMIADSQALAGFGFLAAVGEITCLSTALFLLPAWLFARKPAPEPVEVVSAPEAM